jgi:hypothetical protein
MMRGPLDYSLKKTKNAWPPEADRILALPSGLVHDILPTN